MALHGADALVVNISQTPGVVILEYEVQGNAVGSGKLYENRFISVVTIEDRKPTRGLLRRHQSTNACPHSAIGTKRTNSASCPNASTDPNGTFEGAARRPLPPQRIN